MGLSDNPIDPQSSPGVSGAGHLRPRADHLLAFARSLASAVTFEAVARAIAFQARRVVSADECVVVFRGIDADLGRLDSWSACGDDDPVWSTSQNSLEPGRAVAIALRERRTVVAEGADGSVTAALEVGGPRRVAVEVRWSRARGVGRNVLDDLEFMAELGRQALDRAHLYDRQRAVARELQSAMLPSGLPELDGVEVTARYSPSAVDLEVGGDWYDCGVLGDGRLVFAVGDVVGRGLDAASTMGRLRQSFAALLANTYRVESLTEKLEIAAHAIDGSFMATAIVAALDTASGDLALVSAGHVPPLIVRANGSSTIAEVRGLPLGLGEGEERSVYRENLASGDVLVLYTDGLVDADGVDLDDNLKRLRATVESCVGSSSEEICDHVIETMGADTNIDDIAMLCVIRD